MKTYIALILTAVFFIPMSAFAWGRRGHQIVGETAAMLASQEPKGEFLNPHSFDFGVYANEPDFVWKRPATYNKEYNEHYINLEVFERAFAKKPEIKNPFALDRREFEKTFPEVSSEYGRVFWRIRELENRLGKLSQRLRDLKDADVKTRQKAQEPWMLTAGIMAHYLGDLSQPLHVSENYNGKMTGQEGIHSFFEDICTDSLYPQLAVDVRKAAEKRWPEFKKKNASKSVLDLILQEAEGSRAATPGLLALDKKLGRSDVKKAAKGYHDLIVARLVEGTLTLAEIYRRNLGFDFNNDKFYYLEGAADYILPGDTGIPPLKAESK